MKIRPEIYRQLVYEAFAGAPLECCGYLAGAKDTVEKVYPMTNMDQSRDHYSFDPREQFSTVKRIRKENLKLLGVYHSHPETSARPSEEDIRLAYDTDLHHVIISLCGAQAVVRSFWIRGGQVKPEELILL